MEEINGLAMRVILLNNNVDDDMKQLKSIYELLENINGKQQKNIPRERKRVVKREDTSKPFKRNNLVLSTFSDVINGVEYGINQQDVLDFGFADGDPFQIIKPILWMDKDVSHFIDGMLHDKSNTKRFTLNLARHMWGTRVLAAAKFLPHERSQARTYLRAKDPTGYEVFQNVMRCFYIWYELREQPTLPRFQEIIDTPAFIKWYRRQLCMIMQSSRDSKRQKNIGPFQAYYYKLLDLGYKPREDWSLDSERIPSKYYHPCFMQFDIQYPISKIVYTLKCTETPINTPTIKSVTSRKRKTL